MFDTNSLTSKILIGVGCTGLGMLTIWHIGAYMIVRNLESPKYTVIKKFDTNNKKNIVELRKYDAYIIAETLIEKQANNQNMKDITGDGFREVAKYIFVGNKSRHQPNNEKISMTSPVMTEINSSEKISMTLPVMTEITGTSTGTTTKSEKISMTSPVMTEITSQTPLMQIDDKVESIKVSFYMPYSKYKKIEDLPIPDSKNLTLREVPEHYMLTYRWNGKQPNEETLTQKSSILKESMLSNGIVPIANANIFTMGYDPPFSPSWMRRNEIAIKVEKPAE